MTICRSLTCSFVHVVIIITAFLVGTFQPLPELISSNSKSISASNTSLPMMSSEPSHSNEKKLDETLVPTHTERNSKHDSMLNKLLSYPVSSRENPKIGPSASDKMNVMSSAHQSRIDVHLPQDVSSTDVSYDYGKSKGNLQEEESNDFTGRIDILDIGMVNLETKSTSISINLPEEIPNDRKKPALEVRLTFKSNQVDIPRSISIQSEEKTTVKSTDTKGSYGIYLESDGATTQNSVIPSIFNNNTAELVEELENSPTVRNYFSQFVETTDARTESIHLLSKIISQTEVVGETSTKVPEKKISGEVDEVGNSRKSYHLTSQSRSHTRNPPAARSMENFEGSKISILPLSSSRNLEILASPSNIEILGTVTDVEEGLDSNSQKGYPTTLTSVSNNAEGMNENLETEESTSQSVFSIVNGDGSTTKSRKDQQDLANDVANDIAIESSGIVFIEYNKKITTPDSKDPTLLTQSHTPDKDTDLENGNHDVTANTATEYTEQTSYRSTQNTLKSYPNEDLISTVDTSGTISMHPFNIKLQPNKEDPTTNNILPDDILKGTSFESSQENASQSVTSIKRPLVGSETGAKNHSITTDDSRKTVGTYDVAYNLTDIPTESVDSGPNIKQVSINGDDTEKSNVIKTIAQRAETESKSSSIETNTIGLDINPTSKIEISDIPETTANPFSQDMGEFDVYRISSSTEDTTVDNSFILDEADIEDITTDKRDSTGQTSTDRVVMPTVKLITEELDIPTLLHKLSSTQGTLPSEAGNELKNTAFDEQSSTSTSSLEPSSIFTSAPVSSDRKEDSSSPLQSTDADGFDSDSHPSNFNSEISDAPSGTTMTNEDFGPKTSTKGVHDENHVLDTLASHTEDVTQITKQITNKYPPSLPSQANTDNDPTAVTLPITNLDALDERSTSDKNEDVTESENGSMVSKDGIRVRYEDSKDTASSVSSAKERVTSTESKTGLLDSKVTETNILDEDTKESSNFQTVIRTERDLESEIMQSEEPDKLSGLDDFANRQNDTMVYSTEYSDELITSETSRRKRVIRSSESSLGSGSIQLRAEGNIQGDTLQEPGTDSVSNLDIRGDVNVDVSLQADVETKPVDALPRFDEPAMKPTDLGRPPTSPPVVLPTFKYTSPDNRETGITLNDGIDGILHLDVSSDMPTRAGFTFPGDDIAINDMGKNFITEVKKFFTEVSLPETSTPKESDPVSIASITSPSAEDEETIEQDPSMTSTEQDPSMTSTEQDPSMKSTEQDPSMPSTEQDPSMKSTEQDPSMPSTEQDPSMKSTEQDPSMPSTEQDPSMKSTEQDPSMPSTEQDPSMTSIDLTTRDSTPAFVTPTEIPGNLKVVSSEANTPTTSTQSFTEIDTSTSQLVSAKGESTGISTSVDTTESQTTTLLLTEQAPLSTDFPPSPPVLSTIATATAAESKEHETSTKPTSTWTTPKPVSSSGSDLLPSTGQTLEPPKKESSPPSDSSSSSQVSSTDLSPASTTDFIPMNFQFTINADYDEVVGNRKDDFQDSLKEQLSQVMRLPLKCIQNLLVARGSIEVSFDLVPAPEYGHLANEKALKAAADELKRLIDNGELDLSDLDGNKLLVIPIDPPTPAPPSYDKDYATLIIGIIIGAFVITVVMVIITVIVVKRKAGIGHRLSPVEEARSKLPTYRDIPFQEALYIKGSGRGKYNGKYCYNSGHWLGPGPEPRLGDTPDPVKYRPPTDSEIRRTPRPPTAVRERLKNNWNLDWDLDVSSR